MELEKFDLTWNDFGKNAEKMIRNLANDSLFTDVTLVSDDMKRIKAHKVILCSGSQFFKQILSETLTYYPLLFLKGVQYQELKAIVNFLYMGTAQVNQEDLNNFIQAAGDLQIEGLQENINVGNNFENTFDDQPIEKNENHAYYNHDSFYEIETKHNELELYETQDHPSNLTDYQIRNIERKEDGSYSCDECDYKTKKSDHLKRHRMGKHEGVKFQCHQCKREFSTKTNLKTHVQSKHEGKTYECEKCNIVFNLPTTLSLHRAKYHK